MKLSRTSAGAAAILLLLTTAACGDEDGEDGSDDRPVSASPSTPRTSPSDDAATSTPSATSTPHEPAPPFPANTDKDTQKHGKNAALTVTDIRVGRHEGFDRVVYQLAGSGKPGWLASYTDDPVADPEGSTVSLPGDGDLQVIIRGLTFPPDESLGAYDGPDKIGAKGTDEITVVWWGGVFEGQSQSLIGLDDDDHPFRVFALDNPTRVVVDVRDDD